MAWRSLKRILKDDIHVVFPLFFYTIPRRVNGFTRFSGAAAVALLIFFACVSFRIVPSTGCICGQFERCTFELKPFPRNVYKTCAIHVVFKDKTQINIDLLKVISRGYWHGSNILALSLPQLLFLVHWCMYNCTPNHWLRNISIAHGLHIFMLVLLLLCGI